MTRDEANTIITALTAAFPSVRLQEDTPDVWRKYLIPLDFATADRAVAQCVLNCKFFPPIAEFRDFYRLERNQVRTQESREEPAGDDIPEWVQVWWWNLNRSRTDRQVANESVYPKCKVEERPPKRMRGFPQEHDPGPDPLTMDEYETIRAAWVKDGSPTASAWEIISA